MKIKIGDKIIDSDDQMVMVILSDEEKGHIANMGDATKYCVAPESTSEQDMKDFMVVE